LETHEAYASLHACGFKDVFLMVNEGAKFWAQLSNDDIFEGILFVARDRA
jgi:hypothetical protein